MSALLDKLTNDTFLAFIRANEHAELTKLLFAGNKPDVDVKLAADQILSRRKSKGKLASWLAGEGIIFPPPLSIEQASSDITAAYKSRLITGSHLVDLTGGMGVDTLALSNYFERTTYIEQDPWLCEVFQHNVNSFGRENIAIINKRSEDYLSDFGDKAYFFIDPARRDSYKQKVFRFNECTPDITKILFMLKEKALRLLVKASPMIDLTEGIRALKYVQNVHILSIKNDCKEVLFDIEFKKPNENPVIHTVNFTDQGTEEYSFNFAQKIQADVNFGPAKRYLYEPNASVLKGGGFSSICAGFPVDKLHQNTHLYTSDVLVENFPGRKFIIIKNSVKKEEIPVLLPDKKANIITRNYPMSPIEIKKKYKLKDGGHQYIIGYRDFENKARLAIADRLK